MNEYEFFLFHIRISAFLISDFAEKQLSITKYLSMNNWSLFPRARLFMCNSALPNVLQPWNLIGAAEVSPHPR